MIRIIKILFILFITPSLGVSQSLNELIDKELDDFFYGRSYCHSIDSLTSIAENGGSHEEFKELQGLKALCYSNFTNRDSIENLLSSVLTGNTLRAQGLSKAIQGYLLMGNSEDELAIQMFTDAIGLFDPERDEVLITITQLSLAWAYYGVFSFDLAIKYAHQGLANAYMLNNPYNVIEGLDILSNAHMRLDKRITADSFFNEYLSIASTIDNPLVAFWAHSTAGHQYVSAELHDSAHLSFYKSYEAAVILNDSILQLEALLYLGENAQMNGDSKSAIQYLTQVNNLPEKYHRSALDRRMNEYLAEAHESEGNFLKAFQHLKAYKAIDDVHWNEESREITSNFEAKYQSMQKDSEIKKQEFQLSKRTMERNFFLAGTAALGLLLWFLYYRNKKNESLSASTIQNLEKQQKLLAMDYMVQGQEEERKRIAQDLHDGLGGLLTTARLQLKAVHDEIEKLGELNLLSKAEVMIDNACTEVRRIAHDMMPGALIDLGLIDATEDLAIKLGVETGIQIKIIDQTSNVELTDNQKIQLYRAIQEILSNTVKHAQANIAQIEFNNSPSAFTVTLTDDGKGFDTEGVQDLPGLGITNIESRVKYLNGNIELSSSPNQGTKYVITIPI